VEAWYARVLYNITEGFYKHQKYPASQFRAVVHAGTTFQNLEIFNIGFTDIDFAGLISQNYKWGSPLVCGSFAAVITMEGFIDVFGKPAKKDLLFITLETPLKKERQIYNIALTADGKKYFELDEYLSVHLQLPIEVNRCGAILQPAININ
jgi:hypothetical protein